MDSMRAPSGQGILVESPVPSEASQPPAQVDSFRTPMILFNPDPSNRISLATLHRCVQVRILIAFLPSVQYPPRIILRASHNPHLHFHHAQMHSPHERSRGCVRSYAYCHLVARQCISGRASHTPPDRCCRLASDR